MMRRKALAFLLLAPFAIAILSFVTSSYVIREVEQDIQRIDWEYKDNEAISLEDRSMKLTADAVYDERYPLSEGNKLVWSLEAMPPFEDVATLETVGEDTYAIFHRPGRVGVICSNEKKNVRWVFLCGTIMFFLGCAIGYLLVFPMTLRFLATYQLSPTIIEQVSLESYMDNFLMLIFVMGVVFEMPLVSWLLSQIGVLNRSFFHKYRRHAIVALLIGAAFITPSSDPFTLGIVFFPLYGLYELSAFFVKPAPPEEEEEELEEQGA